MKKLSGIKNFEDFKLAIKNGAEVNGTFHDVPFVCYYLRESTNIHHYGKQPINIENIIVKDERFLKFQLLVNSGADMGEMFRTNLGSVYSYRYYELIFVAIRSLLILNLIISNSNAREKIAESKYFTGLLMEVLDMIKKTEIIIDEIGI